MIIMIIYHYLFFLISKYKNKKNIKMTIFNISILKNQIKTINTFQMCILMITFSIWIKKKNKPLIQL